MLVAFKRAVLSSSFALKLSFSYIFDCFGLKYHFDRKILFKLASFPGGYEICHQISSLLYLLLYSTQTRGILAHQFFSPKFWLICKKLALTLYNPWKGGDPKMKFLHLFLSAVRRPPIRPTIKNFSWHCPCPSSDVRPGINPIRCLHFRAKHFKAKRFRAKHFRSNFWY